MILQVAPSLSILGQFILDYLMPVQWQIVPTRWGLFQKRVIFKIYMWALYWTIYFLFLYTILFQNFTTAWSKPYLIYRDWVQKTNNKKQNKPHLFLIIFFCFAAEKNIWAEIVFFFKLECLVRKGILKKRTIFPYSCTN